MPTRLERCTRQRPKVGDASNATCRHTSIALIGLAQRRAPAFLAGHHRRSLLSNSCSHAAHRGVTGSVTALPLRQFPHRSETPATPAMPEICLSRNRNVMWCPLVGGHSCHRCQRQLKRPRRLHPSIVPGSSIVGNSAHVMAAASEVQQSPHRLPLFGDAATHTAKTAHNAALLRPAPSTGRCVTSATRSP